MYDFMLDFTVHNICTVHFYILSKYNRQIDRQTITFTVEPLLWGHPFCIRKKAFQEGWPLIRGRNRYIYVYIYSV